jgi:O-antigen/teichoic acid export membrane protein
MIQRIYRKLHTSGRHFWDFIGTALLDQTLVSGISFFVGFFLARHLGMDLFGRFSLLMLVAYFSLEVQRALVIAPMMALLAKEDDPSYLAQLGYLQMGLNLVLSLGSSGFVYLSGYLFPKWGIAPLAFLAFFLVFARLQQEFLRRIFFVQNFSRRALILDTITFFCILLSIFALVHFERLSLNNVLWWHVAAYLCPSFLFMRHVLHPQWLLSHWPKIIKEHITFGQWLLGSTLVQFLSSNWLVMISGAILGAGTVGIFKSAQYLTGGVTMLFQALENVVPLRLARLYRLPDPSLRHRYIKAVALFLLVFISGYVLAMAYCVPFFAHYMHVGNETLFYRLSIGLLLQCFLLGPVLLLGYILRAQAKTKPIFYTNIVTASASVLTASFVVVTWREMGIVYGISLIQFFVIISLSLFIWKGRQRA